MNPNATTTLHPIVTTTLNQDATKDWITTTEASITTSGGKDITNPINFLLLSLSTFAANS